MWTSISAGAVAKLVGLVIGRFMHVLPSRRRKTAANR